MTRCPRCGGALRAPEEQCRTCAAPAAERTVVPGAAPTTVAQQVGPMLARANLLRMRGQWSEASDLCAEALRADPRNATAHSLLGDVCQDQGRADEARHWYQLALELNPASEADRAKLSRAEEALEAREQRAEWKAVIEGKRQPVAVTLLLRESLQRMGALAGAALCGIILVMATVVSVSERTRAVSDEEGIPSLMAPRRSRQRVVPETAREQRLSAQLARTKPRGPAQLLHLSVDPRTSAAHVRLFLPRNARPEGTAEARTAVMREGYRWAQAVQEADPSLSAVDVYVVGQTDGPGSEPSSEYLLVGTLTQGDLVVAPDAVTAAELEQFYQRVSQPAWAPQLAGR